MIPCKNKQFGYPEWFGSTHGMRIHMRKCTSSANISKKRKKFKSLKPALSEEKNYPIRRSENIVKDMFSPQLDMIHTMDVFEKNFQKVVPLSEILVNAVDKEQFQKYEKSPISALQLKLAIIGRKAARSDVADILIDPFFDYAKFIATRRKYQECLTEEKLLIENSRDLFRFKK